MHRHRWRNCESRGVSPGKSPTPAQLGQNHNFLPAYLAPSSLQAFLGFFGSMRCTPPPHHLGRTMFAASTAASLILVLTWGVPVEAQAPFWLAALPVGESMFYEGMLADRKCVDSRVAPDGTDMLTGPEEHTLGCLLMPECVASGFTLLQRGRTDGLWYPVYNFSAAMTSQLAAWLQRSSYGPSRRNLYLRFFGTWMPGAAASASNPAGTQLTIDTTSTAAPAGTGPYFPLQKLHLPDLPSNVPRNRNCSNANAATAMKCLDASAALVPSSLSAGPRLRADCARLTTLYRACGETVAATCPAAYAFEMGRVSQSAACLEAAAIKGLYVSAADAIAVANHACDDGVEARAALCSWAATVSGAPVAVASAASSGPSPLAARLCSLLFVGIVSSMTLV